MNTIDKYTDEITFIKIIDKTIDEFIDDTITTIGDYAFHTCSQLTSIDLPVATTIGDYAFVSCSQLTSVDLPKVTYIGNYVFSGCSQLTSVILRSSTVATLANTNAFNNANNAIIYVPDELVDDYKAADNWSTYADRIKGISELPTN